MCGHISYLLLGEKSPVFLCMMACGYSHNDVLINAVIFIASIVKISRSRGPISPQVLLHKYGVCESF